MLTIKKFFFCIVTTLCLVSQLNASGSDYLQRTLQKIEKDSEKATTIYQRTELIDDVQLWFTQLIKLNLSEDETETLLKKAHPIIENITANGDDTMKFLFPRKLHKSTEVTIDGIPTTAYLNVQEPVFQQELESYAKYRHFDLFELNQETFENLEYNYLYNFVITLDGRVNICPAQDCDLIHEGDVKVLLSPNHAILGSSQPVLTAGEIFIIGNDKIKIIYIGITSGHYRPLYESRKYIIEKMLSYGVKREQMVTTVFSITRLPWKFVSNSSKHH